MAYETKKLVMAVAGGILIAILIISGFVWTGMLPITEAKGLLIVRVKDDPTELNELWLNISAVQVHRKGGGNETWYNVTVVIDTFDLLKLNDTDKVLAVEDLQVGNYTEIRFYIANASANITGEAELKPLQLTAPWVMVKIYFTIEEDSVTSVVIDIDVNKRPILESGNLIPVARATVVEYI
jgi:hypothetical protein